MDRISVPSPLGPLVLEAQDGMLCRISFAPATASVPAPAAVPGAGENASVLRGATEQLQAYFTGRLRTFTLPLRLDATPFARRVLAAVAAIPYGATRTYGQIAACVGNPRACRAVGSANHRNPLPIVIPCHRVIGSDGGLIGYGGGLWRKQYLLALEAKICL